MPVPKRKTSKSRRDRRSSTKFIREKSSTKCPNCKEAIAPHSVCNECGHYKGVKIIKTKSEKRQEKGQARKEQETKRQASQAVAQTEPSDSEKE